MMRELQLGAFVLVSAALLYISRRSIVRPRSHGFFRFFAWEAVAALIVLHAPVWFAEWFSAHQMASWVLLLGSLVPLALGLKAIRQRGVADGIVRRDPELLGFERTGKLISQGIFRYIRHPLYCSLLLLAWGVFFKAPAVAAGLLAVLATVFLLLAARADERECIAAFGDAYRNYMHGTKLFIPYVW